MFATSSAPAEAAERMQLLEPLPARHVVEVCVRRGAIIGVSM